MTKVMLEEVKLRFGRVLRAKIARFEKENPYPELPARLLRKIEREQKQWQERRDELEKKAKARNKFCDRIFFDHENAILLLKDSERFSPSYADLHASP